MAMKRDPVGGQSKGRTPRGAGLRVGTRSERVPVDPPSRNESNRLEAGEIAPALEAWFPQVARDLPWRRNRTPYRVLVSEAMLQQTQVARVAERFPRFIARFPSIRRLAGSSIDEVLQEWEGLGYYRRARLLHQAARAIQERHGGRVPSEVSALRALPGVGPYTAGALASLAFGRSEAIVDGNVARVLIRLSGRVVAGDDPEVVRWCWTRSRELVAASADPAVLNEALMELGATVCTPRSPTCSECPIASTCAAHREGSVDRTPLAKSRPDRKRVVHHVIVLSPHRRGRRLCATLRKRPDTGLWASMWEFPSVESPRRMSVGALERHLGAGRGSIRRVDSFRHATTHREVEFLVHELERAALGKSSPPFADAESVEVDRLAVLAMSVPQRRIADAFATRWSADPAQPSSRRGPD